MQKQTCDRCGAVYQLQWKCQTICTNCGAKLDCSDLFIEWERLTRRHLQRAPKSPTPDHPPAK